MSISTGEGEATSSGSLIVKTLNAGASGVSGMISFTTGTASSGSSGKILLATGSATNGKGGDIVVSVGESDSYDASVGGDVQITAGRSKMTGGIVSIMSGESFTRTSGAVVVKTMNAGTSGVSGTLSFATGTTSSGASGKVIIASGYSNGGRSGDVALSVGPSSSSKRGRLRLEGIINHGSDSVTISSSTISIDNLDSSFVHLSSASASATLSTINDAQDGDFLILKAAAGKTITLSEAGNILCGSNKALSGSSGDVVTLICKFFCKPTSLRPPA